MSDYILHKGELYHYGVKGMKWGVRRYQNNDGTLTDVGKEKYYNDDERKQLFKSSKKDGLSNLNNNDDVKQAGSFLRKQSGVVEHDFQAYCDSYTKDLKNLITDKKFKNEIKKKIDSDISEMYDTTNGFDLNKIKANDVDSVIRSHLTEETLDKYISSDTKKHLSNFEKGVDQYMSNVKNIVDDMVGKHGNESITTGYGAFLAKKSKYKDIVYQQIRNLGQSSYIRYLNNHTNMALYDNPNRDILVDTILHEWGTEKSKSRKK